MGRLLVCFMMVCNIGAMVLYILDVQSGKEASCGFWTEFIDFNIVIYI